MNHHLQGEHRIKPISFCFNLKVPKGSLIAIVGDIGSGKSTLLNSLLASLYRWSGEVMFFTFQVCVDLGFPLGKGKRIYLLLCTKSLDHKWNSEGKYSDGKPVR